MESMEKEEVEGANEGGWRKEQLPTVKPSFGE